MKRISRLFFLVFLLVNMNPIALAQQAADSSSYGIYSWEAVKVIISLALVLFIFYLFVYVFKRYSGLSIKSHTKMQVIGGISLGSKEKLVIVKAGSANLLLGVSTAGITRLHEFSSDEFGANEECHQATSFAHHIEKVLNKKPS